MKVVSSLSMFLKPISLLTITILTTSLFVCFFSRQSRAPSNTGGLMARSFLLWLHGLGDSGPANEPIRTFFTSPQFRNAVWSFPSAPSTPVTCNSLRALPRDIFKLRQQDRLVNSIAGTATAACKVSSHLCDLLFFNDGAVMPSWFDIYEIPITAESPKDESGLLKAVQNVHAMIDKEVAAGTNPENIFVCGFSQGGALTLASVLFYPKTLGGGAVFSGWVPFNSSVIDKITPEAKKTPILWSHGMADRTVLFEAGQAGPPFLQQAGMTCEFKAYPDLGHSLSSEELRSLESWIKTRLRSSS